MADFFNKIAGEFNKGMTAVSANSKAMVEKTKVNSAISATDKERTHLFLQLGQKVFDGYVSSGSVDMDETITNLLEEIKRCNARIAQHQEQLGIIEAEVKKATEAAAVAAAERSEAKVSPVSAATHVPSSSVVCACGYANPEGYKFCAGCGCQAVEATSANVSCACGHPNPADSKFCADCGNQI